MKRALVTALIAGALALAGCGGDEQPAAEATSAPAEIVIATAAPAEAVAEAVAEAAAEAVAAPAEEVGATGEAAADATAVDAPAADAAAPAPGGPGGEGPGVSGEVVAVDGSTVTVQDGRQQATITVLLGDDTQYFTQAAVDLANVAVGETVTAMGTQEGDVFTALRVQVGDEAPGLGGGPQGGGPGGLTPPDGQQPPSDLTPPADGQQPPDAAGGSAGGPPAGMGGARLAGTVTASAAGSLTVATAEGATVQVVLAEGGRVTQQAQTTAADITVGTQIMVTGAADGATVTATSVQIMTGVGPQP